MTDLAALREKILQIIREAPEDDGVYVQAADLLEDSVLQELESRKELRPLKLAILRTFTIEPLVEPLRVKAFLQGFRLKLYLSQFNQVPQEILNDDSDLYEFNPDFILLASRYEELGTEPSKAAETLSDWIVKLRQNSKVGQAHLVVSNFVKASSQPVGTARLLNAELLKRMEHLTRLSIFDLAGLASRIGKDRFTDSVQMARMSNPYHLSVYPAYADALLGHIRGVSSLRKCIVLDLDNTLWSGILGEEGVDGVHPFDAFQNSLLELSKQGVLLAVNSKNNPKEALEMLHKMTLRREHLSALRIDWKDKAENLREIALELNIGLDSLVFMDDSLAECERVRQACPEVWVVQMTGPEENQRYAEILKGLGCFRRDTITEEDRRRTAMYREQAQRKKLEGECGTLEEYYASLKMRGTLWRNNRSQIPRIAQMTQKTNQFNLTTRRCPEGEIGQLMDRAWIYSLQIEDRFGDNGIIAAAVVIPSSDGKEWAIDNLLMSCRVVMRTIEDTLLAEIAEDAAEFGVKRLIGRYIPSGKNQMVEGFYPQRGFALRPVHFPGRMEYLFDLGGKERLKPSPWIELTREAEIRR